MRFIGNIFAGICTFLVVVGGVTALLLFNIEGKAFSVDTYKQAFENQNLYDKMPAVLAVIISTSSTNGGDAGMFLSVLSTEENFAALISPQELKTLTNNILDSTFAYLNHEADSAVVSLSSVKNYIVSDGGIGLVTQLLEDQPPCTVEQIAQITFGLLSGENLLLCDPPDEIMGMVTPLIQTQLQTIMSTLPDQITIISGEKSNTPDDPRIRIDRLRAVMKLTIAIPLLLFPAILVFAVRSLRDLLTWWGWPLLFTGVISFFIALIGSPVVEFLIDQTMQVQTSDFMPPVLLATLRESAGEITRQILNPVGIEGLIIATLGAGMIFSSFILTRTARSNV